MKRRMLPPGIVLAAVLLAAAPVPAAQERLRFATTIPPMADILSNVVGGRGEVSWILPPGASPHTHEPRPSDLRKVEGSQAFFFVDRRLDGWAADLPAARRIRVLSLLPDSLLLEFPAEEDFRAAAAGDPEEGGPHAGHGHGLGTDPHFWTDPLAVRAILPGLAEALGAADPAGADAYRANALAYAVRLDSLHAEIQRRIAPVRGGSVVLSHSFLCYYLHRYGVRLATVIEVIEGREPTARDVQRVIRRASEENAAVVIASPELSRRAADRVAEATGLRVRMVDPLGGGRGLESYEALMLAITDGLVEGMR